MDRKHYKPRAMSAPSRAPKFYERISPGVRAMLWSAFAFSIMSAFVKELGKTLPSIEVAFFRGFTTLILSLILIRKRKLSIWGNQTAWLVMRGVLGFCGVASYFYSLTHLPLSESTVIQFTNPLFVAIGAALLLNEPLRLQSMVGIALGLFGVTLISGSEFLLISPEGQGFAYLAAITGSVAAAMAYLVIRKLKDSEDTAVVVLHLSLWTVPLTVPFMIPVWKTPSARDLVLILLMGAVTQWGQMKMTESLHSEPAARATAVSYAQVGFACVWSVFFFDEVLTMSAILGALLIGSGVLMVARNKAPATAQ